MKVLFYIDEYERWPIALESIHAVIKYGRENNKFFTIEVIANNISVMGLIRSIAQQSGWYGAMLEMYEKGVVFSACRNALLKFNSEGALLCEFISIVPSGTVETIRRQNEGYAYIKP